jgi:hypothetical protein
VDLKAYQAQGMLLIGVAKNSKNVVAVKCWIFEDYSSMTSTKMFNIKKI